MWVVVRDDEPADKVKTTLAMVRPIRGDGRTLRVTERGTRNSVRPRTGPACELGTDVAVESRTRAPMPCTKPLPQLLGLR
jgi:hypothetical protein